MFSKSSMNFLIAFHTVRLQQSLLRTYKLKVVYIRTASIYNALWISWNGEICLVWKRYLLLLKQLLGGSENRWSRSYWQIHKPQIFDSFWLKVTFLLYPWLFGAGSITADWHVLPHGVLYWAVRSLLHFHARSKANEPPHCGRNQRAQA